MKSPAVPCRPLPSSVARRPLSSPAARRSLSSCAARRPLSSVVLRRSPSSVVLPYYFCHFPSPSFDTLRLLHFFVISLAFLSASPFHCPLISLIFLPHTAPRLLCSTSFLTLPPLLSLNITVRLVYFCFDLLYILSFVTFNPFLNSFTVYSLFVILSLQ